MPSSVKGELSYQEALSAVQKLAGDNTFCLHTRFWFNFGKASSRTKECGVFITNKALQWCFAPTWPEAIEKMRQQIELEKEN